MNRLFLESLVRRAANRVGLDIRRHRPMDSETGRLARMLAHHHVTLVIDIGANIGQFGRALRAGGYCRTILSFEPLAAAHRELSRATRSDNAWHIAPRVAISDRAGEVELRVAGNSVSSSVLDMLALHESAAPGSSYVGRERVPADTLDALVLPTLQAHEVSFLKIDAQGYEDRVLDGASGLLSRVAGVQLELSLVPLYDGQKLFDDLRDRLACAGFSLWAIWPGFHDPATGRMLQVDAVFFRG